MSVIRTDYMTPMSNIGAGVNQFMQTAASTVGRIPEERERMAALKEQKEVAQLNKEKLLSDNKYYQASIDSMINDIQTTPVGMVPFKDVAEMRKLTDRLEFLKENKSEKAFDEISIIAKNFGTVASTRKQFGDEKIFKGPYLTYNDAVNPKFTEEYLTSAKTAKETHINQMGVAAASKLIQENSDPKTGNPPDTEILVGKLVTMMSDPESGFPSGSETKALGWIKEASLGQKERLTAEAAGINAAARRTSAQTAQLKAKTEADSKPKKSENLKVYETVSRLRNDLMKSDASYQSTGKEQIEQYRIMLAVLSAADSHGEIYGMDKAANMANQVLAGKRESPIQKSAARLLGLDNEETTPQDVSRSGANTNTPVHSQTSTGKKYTVTPITPD